MHKTLERYPEQVEYQDHQPSRYPADGADDYGEQVDGQVIGQERVGQEQEDQPDDGVGYEPTYESHTPRGAPSVCRLNTEHQSTVLHRTSENASFY